MDHAYTQKLQDWLAQPKEQRDLAQGALYVLQLSGNSILYNNIMRSPEKYADVIEYQMQKYLPFRLADLTHTQVVEMQQQVDVIVTEHHLDKSRKEIKTLQDEWKKGKREDHDTLPDDIQGLYAENLNIMQLMRRLHTRLSMLSTEKSPCPDSERYPFLKELIALDKRYHQNWQTYDTYGREA